MAVRTTSEAVEAKKQSKEWIAKRVASLKGKKRTLEQKKKMSKAQKKRFKRTGPNKIFGVIPSKETRIKLSEVRKGYKVSIKTREKISNSLKGHPGAYCKHTKETKEKMSRIAALRIKEGRHNNGRGKMGFFYSKKNQKNLFFRSHLERDWYILLENMKKVESYQIEPVHISYIWENFMHLYIPDLLISYVDGSLELVEIKPEYEWETLKNQAKWKAAKSWCNKKENKIKQFKVYGYKQLRKLSCL